MKKIAPVFFLVLILMASCTDKQSNNPLLTKWETPFGVPPFDLIRTEHFMPAFKASIAENQKEIDAIVGNKEAPSFENTIAALDYSGASLTRVSNVFFNLNSTNTNDSLQAIAKEVAPMLSEHGDNITMNKALFERVKAVYDARESLNLGKEQARLLEETYKRFVRSGANLDDKSQQKMRDINKELSVLTVQFGENVLNETNEFQLVIDKQEDLAGLPQSLIDAGAVAASERKMEGKWVYTLHNPSLIPFLQYAEKRELREKIWRAYMSRGSNGNKADNRQSIEKIVNLRIEKAKLLGYSSHAAFVLAENMAKTPEKVQEFLMKLWQPALRMAQTEAADLAKMARSLENIKVVKVLATSGKIEPWDWRFYAEKLRKQRYDLDEEQIRPYFKLENVRDGIFELCKRLYGLSFVEKTNLPKYDSSAVSYEVLEENGSHVGILYMDFHPRASKRSGAWMTSFRDQFRTDQGEKISPVISIVTNFSPSTADMPSLLTFDEVETFFHEFGHALHGLLSNGTYPSLSGTSVPRDFVELPSQIMENWASEPEMLALYAKHYKTGEVIPQSLVNKIEKSGTFNQGFATVEYLAASILDMEYHSLQAPIGADPLAFEKAAMDRIGLISEIIPRYRSPYFQHIFSGGYSSGYYSYIWAEVLDADAFQAFKESSLFDKETARKFRENILEKGGTDDPMKMYVGFRGREPEITPLLKKRGLI